MANDFEVTVPVEASADAAWALAGDPARVNEWFGPVVEVTIVGDERHAVMGNGATLVERLVERDDVARQYSYEVVSGIPGLTSHKATIRVAADGETCVVGWRQTATSDDPDYDIEARLRTVMTRGLEQLRDQLEGRR
jgi:Polyketide cyclase / dehydrase and lipid transport